jgi:hypothetical protein
MKVTFRRAGGTGTFVDFNVTGGYGHGMLHVPALWEGPLAAYLAALPDAAP